MKIRHLKGVGGASTEAFVAIDPISTSNERTFSRENRSTMRYMIPLAVLVFFTATVASAHPPVLPAPPAGYRFEPIPPLGNNLPWSYRARKNRPTYIGGKIAYYIAPSSQEAMSWHEHVHRGSYRNHAGWIEPHYMYAKPWEVLTVGPRTPAEMAPATDPKVPVPLDYGY
jgi:hypothetical protein